MVFRVTLKRRDDDDGEGKGKWQTLRLLYMRNALVNLSIFYRYFESDPFANSALIFSNPPPAIPDYSIYEGSTHQISSDFRASYQLQHLSKVVSKFLDPVSLFTGAHFPYICAY